MLLIAGIIAVSTLAGCASSVDTASVRKDFSAKNAIGNDGIICVYRNNNSSEIFTYITLLKYPEAQIKDSSSQEFLQKIKISTPSTRSEGILSDDTYLGWVIHPGKYAVATSIAKKGCIPSTYIKVFVFEISGKQHFSFLVDANGNISTVSDIKVQKDIKDMWSSKKLSSEYLQQMNETKSINETPDTAEDAKVVSSYIGTGIGYTIIAPFYVVYGVGWFTWQVFKVRYGVGNNGSDGDSGQWAQQEQIRQQNELNNNQNQNQLNAMQAQQAYEDRKAKGF